MAVTSPKRRTSLACSSVNAAIRSGAIRLASSFFASCLATAAISA